MIADDPSRTDTEFICSITTSEQSRSHREWRDHRRTHIQRYRHAVAACMAESGHHPPSWGDCPITGLKVIPVIPSSQIARSWSDSQAMSWISAILKAMELCVPLRPVTPDPNDTP